MPVFSSLSCPLLSCTIRCPVRTSGTTSSRVSQDGQTCLRYLLWTLKSTLSSSHPTTRNRSQRGSQIRSCSQQQPPRALRGTLTHLIPQTATHQASQGTTQTAGRVAAVVVSSSSQHTSPTSTPLVASGRHHPASKMAVGAGTTVGITTEVSKALTIKQQTCCCRCVWVWVSQCLVTSLALLVVDMHTCHTRRLRLFTCTV